MKGLVSFIRESCPKLHFNGLMSMGMLNDIEGFSLMYKLKQELADENLKEEDFILSMGTSADFEIAI